MTITPLFGLGRDSCARALVVAGMGFGVGLLLSLLSLL